VVEDASPNGVEDRDGAAAEKLLPRAAQSVGEEDGGVEAGEVTGAGGDDVADGRVPECFIWGGAGAVTDLGEDEGLV
jgi:hypothetical protein